MNQLPKLPGSRQSICTIDPCTTSPALIDQTSCSRCNQVETDGLPDMTAVRSEEQRRLCDIASMSLLKHAVARLVLACQAIFSVVDMINSEHILLELNHPQGCHPKLLHPVRMRH